MSLLRLLLPLALGLGACVKQPDIVVLKDWPLGVQPKPFLHKDEILAVIRTNRQQIRDCYEKHLKSVPGLQGKVAVKFVIGADGRVTKSSVHESTVGDPELGGCVSTRVGTFRFPPPRGGGVVIVTYPFTFKLSPEG